MHPALNIAIKAARRAEKIITHAALNLEHLQIALKSQHDYVTEVDKAAEAEIISVLQEAYPEYSILAEESGFNPEKSEKNSGYQWIVDPLDGTTNFIHGFPQYAISIALVKDGQPQHALVYDLTRNELFTASRGTGAFLNNRRIRVSGRLRMEEALLGTGFPFRKFDQIDRYLKIFRHLVQKTSGIRRPGSAALDLAYVACGRLDGFWEFGLSPWDIAAGILLISEAGGFVSDTDSDISCLETGNVVAATPKIFPTLIQAVQNPEEAT